MNNPGTMKAVQLDAPGPPQALHLRDLPMPQPSAGWVRIRVEAFGLNRSELHLRLGLAESVTFPRVPGIECAGVVDAAPGTSFRRGQQVVAMMGGMGRVFDGQPRRQSQRIRERESSPPSCRDLKGPGTPPR